MTNPKHWSPGDPIEAARLNAMQQVSEIPKRQMVLGGSTSAINEAMGNQSVERRTPAIKLVVATNDFAISETPTDLTNSGDDVPSGLVKEVRLNRRTGNHKEDSTNRPFLAYDVIGGLSNFTCSAASDSVSASESGSASDGSESGSALGSKEACDVFYVFFNTDSKRWEVLEGGGSGGDIIQFRPTDVCEGIGLTCDCVTAEVVTATCGSGLSPGDVVQVWDQSRGWFQMPEELLFASVGWAHKVKVTETDQYDLPFPIGPCRWVVFSMDCVEQDIEE